MDVIKVETVGPIKPPVHTPALSPAEFAKGKQTVTMIFDKPVLLTIKHGVRVSYPTGVHEVPVDVKNHWYLVAHNVREYAKPNAVAADVPAAVKRVQRQQGQDQRR